MTIQTNDYGCATNKEPREVILLNTVGGCSWSRCAFCDLCSTYNSTADNASKHNKRVLSKVVGFSSTLQVLCSANFCELPAATWFDLLEVCIAKNIKTLLVETHWLHREMDIKVKSFFSNAGITVRFIYGIESFDFSLREARWFKGYGNVSIDQLKVYADRVNLLIGVEGQTLDTIQADITKAIINFEHTYIYAFEPNDTPIKRDNTLMELFYESKLFRDLMFMPNVEILDGLDRRAPDNLGNVGIGPKYNN